MNATMTMPMQTRRSKPEKGLGPLHEPAAFVDGPNQYQYVGGDPVGAVDPEGMQGVHFDPLGPHPVPTSQAVAADMLFNRGSVCNLDAWEDLANSVGGVRGYADLVANKAVLAYPFVPTASSFLMHYLSADGASRVVNLGKALEGDEAAISDAFVGLNDAMRYVEKTTPLPQAFMTRGFQPIVFTTWEFHNSLAHASTWSEFTNVRYISRNVRRIADPGGDPWLPGTRKPDCYYEMDWTLKLWDFYDFEMWAPAGQGAFGIRDRAMAALQQLGMARAFEVTGATSAHVVWYKGQYAKDVLSLLGGKFESSSLAPAPD